MSDQTIQFTNLPPICSPASLSLTVSGLVGSLNNYIVITDGDGNTIGTMFDDTNRAATDPEVVNGLFTDTIVLNADVMSRLSASGIVTLNIAFGIKAGMKSKPLVVKQAVLKFRPSPCVRMTDGEALVADAFSGDLYLSGYTPIMSDLGLAV